MSCNEQKGSMVAEKEETLQNTQETKDEAVTESPQKPVRNRKIKIDKKHLQGFIAGLLVMAILVTGVTAGFYPGLLTGTFTRQIGNRALQEEVDLEIAACEPYSLKAQLEYEQTFKISIEKDKLKPINKLEKKHIQLAGLFAGLTVESLSYSDSDNRLVVAVKGKTETTHAYGSDKENPNGEIYIMPEALKDEKTAYKAKVGIEYPSLEPDISLLESKEDYKGKISFTLSGDSFMGKPTAEDITLSGGFEKLKVTSVKTEDDILTVGLSGRINSENGNGILTLSGKSLKSGFSVDRVVNIYGAAEFIAMDSITVAEKVKSKVTIVLSNDLFAEELTAGMFTLGNDLAGYQVQSAQRISSLEAALTIVGGALRKPGKGNVTMSAAGSQSGRTISGYINIANPTIHAYFVTSDQPKDNKDRIYEVSSGGDGFMKDITKDDIALKGGLSGMTVKEVKQDGKYRIKLILSGNPDSEKAPVISIRSAAMGGVTGAEATVYEVEDMGILDVKPIDPNDTEMIKTAFSPDLTQTGGPFLDAAFEWGFDKVKSLVVSGLKEGASEGVQFLLRKGGILGPSVADQLGQLQESIAELDKKITQMETNILSKIQAQEVQDQLREINTATRNIKDCYLEYEAIKNKIADFKKKNPNGNPYTNDEIKEMMNALALPGGKIDQRKIDQGVLQIGNIMAGGEGLNSLIETYYAQLKTQLPFEHNAIYAVKKYTEKMLRYQTQGVELYAEFCNYNDRINNIDTKQMLRSFINDFDTRITDQEAVVQQKIPSLDGLNIRKVWGTENSPFFQVKCIENNKRYIFSGAYKNSGEFVYKRADSYRTVGDSDAIFWERTYILDDEQVRNYAVNRMAKPILGLSAFQAYRDIDKPDLEAIFKRWGKYGDGNGGDGAHKFLQLYTGQYGLSNSGWLFLGRGKLANIYYFLGTSVHIVTYYDMNHNVISKNDTWALYQDAPYKDYHIQLAITER